MSEAKEQLELTAELDAGCSEAAPLYEQRLFLWCAILGLGPLALPLIWRHPRIRWCWKLYITLSVVGLTWGCIELTKVMIEHLKEQWKVIEELRS